MWGQSLLPAPSGWQSLTHASWPKGGSPGVAGQDRPWQASKIILILSPHQFLSGLCWNSRRRSLFASLRDTPSETCQSRSSHLLQSCWELTLEIGSGHPQKQREENKLSEKEIATPQKKKNLWKLKSESFMNAMIRLMNETVDEYWLCSDRNAVSLEVSPPPFCIRGGCR